MPFQHEYTANGNPARNRSLDSRSKSSSLEENSDEDTRLRRDDGTRDEDAEEAGDAGELNNSSIPDRVSVRGSKRGRIVLPDMDRETQLS